MTTTDLQIKFIGFQGSYLMFNDQTTGSSFMVGEHETIESATNRIREIWRREPHGKTLRRYTP